MRTVEEGVMYNHHYAILMYSVNKFQVVCDEWYFTLIVSSQDEARAAARSWLSRFS